MEQNKDNLKVYWINPKELIQSKENNKDHRDNLDAIIESLQLFGWQFPLLIDMDLNIISGHGRVQAAIKLGMKEVPVIISCMEKEMADEFRIVDNVTQAAGKIDMIKVTNILKKMDPKSKHLSHIKSIVSDITQIRHWMEDYMEPGNPNKNKKVEDSFRRAREYQDAASLKITSNKSLGVIMQQLCWHAAGRGVNVHGLGITSRVARYIDFYSVDSLSFVYDLINNREAEGPGNGRLRDNYGSYGAAIHSVLTGKLMQYYWDLY